MNNACEDQCLSLSDHVLSDPPLASNCACHPPLASKCACHLLHLML